MGSREPDFSPGTAHPKEVGVKSKLTMKKGILFLVCLFTTVAAQASFLPYFDGIRETIVNRQVEISNAPPFSVAVKRELTLLKATLKAVDKPATKLAADLATLTSVSAKINKGASNEAFALQFRSAASNYYGALIVTNDALVAALTNANNNPALKLKAQKAVNAAALLLASINIETNLAGATKTLSKALTKYLLATKAVVAAVNAKPVPLPTPRAGTVVVDVEGRRYTLGAQFPLRNATGTGMVGSGAGPGSSSTLLVHIDSNEGPGTNYLFSLLFTDTVNGETITFASNGGVATVTAASASALAGSINGTALVRFNGGAPQQVNFKARFSGKKFSFF
jgi:hypothetical protein